MNGNQRREMIMEVVFGLLLHKGYDKVSISDIQQATGAARGLLYHYFGNKDDLLLEVASRMMLSMFEFNQQQVDTMDVQGMIEYVLQLNAQAMQVISKSASEITIADYDHLFYRITRQNEKFAERYRTLRRNEVRLWSEVIGREIDCGALRGDIDATRTASYVTFLMDGAWMNAVAENNQIDMIDTMREALTDYFRVLSS